MTAVDVVVCCGVGGVGKTTLSAAMALGYARAGRRVVVITVDPARRLAEVLGVTLGVDPTPVPAGEGRLHALMLDTAAVFDRTVRELAASPAEADALLANRYYRSVSRRLAGAPEYMALVELHRLVRDGRWDVVVVDTPPAEDALDLFAAPDRVRRVFGKSVLRTLLQPGTRFVELLTRAGANTLARLIGHTVVDDISGFFGLISGMSAGFAAHGEAIAALFGSDRARTLLVVDARTPDRGDALRFREALMARGPRFAGFLLNRCVADPGPTTVPDLPAPADLVAAKWAEALAALVGVATEQSAEAARHRATADRLRAEAPVWIVPEVDGADPIDALRRLAEHLPR